MTDHFKEDIIVRHNRTIPNILYILCWGVLVLFGAIAFMTLQLILVNFSFSSLLILVIGAGGAVFLYFFKDEFKTEYEYTFTNGSLDFAKVLRSARRKELGTMNVKNVSACGHVAHPSFQRFLSMPGLQKKNWFLNRDGNLFYFYYEKEGGKHMIVIEPSEEMVDMIRKYLPVGVYQG